MLIAANIYFEVHFNFSASFNHQSNYATSISWPNNQMDSDECNYMYLL